MPHGFAHARCGLKTPTQWTLSTPLWQRHRTGQRQGGCKKEKAKHPLHTQSHPRAQRVDGGGGQKASRKGTTQKEGGGGTQTESKPKAKKEEPKKNKRGGGSHPWSVFVGLLEPVPPFLSLLAATLLLLGPLAISYSLVGPFSRRWCGLGVVCTPSSLACGFFLLPLAPNLPRRHETIKLRQQTMPRSAPTRQ